MPDTFKPTEKIAANAKKGLKLRDNFGRGGTDVGVRRAEQLAAQDDVTAEDVKSMHSYFARHEVDKDGKTHQTVRKLRDGHAIRRALAWRARGRISGLDRSSAGQIPHIGHRQRDILLRRRCSAFSGLHGA
jgi:hypothetical protein